MMQSNGNSKRSNVPNKNGARIGALSCDSAIHKPKLLIPACTFGHTTARINATIVDHKITTNGTKRFPLKMTKHPAIFYNYSIYYKPLPDKSSDDPYEYSHIQSWCFNTLVKIL